MTEPMHMRALPLNKCRDVCWCQMIFCVCADADQHVPGCAYRTSLLMPYSMPCEHGEDVCLKCFPCNCGGIIDQLRENFFPGTGS